MKTLPQIILSTPDGIAGCAPGVQGRGRLLSQPLEPLFLADWDEVVFVHLEVEAQLLQKYVPFELDLFDGDRAFVSLVAFTMRNLRFKAGGNRTAWMTAPIAAHRFLNARTYVKNRDEKGIYFVCEWMDNAFSRWLGPAVFGLPYRTGILEYQNIPAHGVVQGSVKGKSKTLQYYGEVDQATSPAACPRGGLDEFLVERYTAFLKHPLYRGLFRIWHKPWQLSTLRVDHLDLDLLSEAPGGEDWRESGRLHSAHQSAGVRDVWMGRPHRIQTPMAR